MNREMGAHQRTVGTTVTGRTEPVRGAAADVARSTVHWGSIFAGGFTAVLVYLVLAALGLAFVGGALRGAVEGEGGLGGLGTASAVWLILTTLVALFIGGYAASRVSGLISTRVGRIQGAVVASGFFLLMIMQATSAIGTVGTGIGSVVSAIGGAVPQVAQNERVQSIVRQAIGDADLRTSPDQLMQGIASRLISGDTDAAVSYLASQTGMTEQEARTRINRASSEVQAALTDVGETATRAAQAAAWTLFLALALGGLAAMWGGDLGARRNLRQPLDTRDEGSMTGYTRERERAA